MVRLIKITITAAVLAYTLPSESMEKVVFENQISMTEHINYPKKICLLKEIGNVFFGENHFPAELIQEIIKIDYFLPIEISFPSITTDDLLKLNKSETPTYTNKEGFVFSLLKNFEYNNEPFMSNITGVFYHQYINNSYLFNLYYEIYNKLGLGQVGWCNFLVLQGFSFCEIDPKFRTSHTLFFSCDQHSLYNAPNFKDTKNFEGLKIICYR